MIRLKIIHNGWCHYNLKLSSDIKITSNEVNKILDKFFLKFDNYRENDLSFFDGDTFYVCCGWQYISVIRDRLLDMFASEFNHNSEATQHLKNQNSIK